MMGQYGSGYGMSPRMGSSGYGTSGGFGFPGFGMNPYGMGQYGMSPLGMGYTPASFAGACPCCGATTGTMGAWPASTTYAMGGGFYPGYGTMGPGFMPGFGWGYTGGTYGGTYPGYFTETYTAGAASDDEIRDWVYDTIDADPTVPAGADINVDVNNGIVTLSGTVPNKRVKHAVGDDAWWIPSVVDVHNQLQVTPRKRPEEHAGHRTEARSSRQK